MTLLRFAVTKCGCMVEEYQVFPKTTASTLLSVIILIFRPFTHTNFTLTRSAHKRHINEFKIHIKYLKNHDSTLMLSSIIFTCHPFQPSSISLLKVVNTV